MRPPGEIPGTGRWARTGRASISHTGSGRRSQSAFSAQPTKLKGETWLNRPVSKELECQGRTRTQEEQRGPSPGEAAQVDRRGDRAGKQRRCRPGTGQTSSGLLRDEDGGLHAETEASPREGKAVSAPDANKQGRKEHTAQHEHGNTLRNNDGSPPRETETHQYWQLISPQPEGTVQAALNQEWPEQHQEAPCRLSDGLGTGVGEMGKTKRTNETAPGPVETAPEWRRDEDSGLTAAERTHHVGPE